VASAVSVASALSYDQGLLKSDLLCGYCTSGIHKGTLFHSIEDLWNTTLFMMKQVAEENLRWRYTQKISISLCSRNVNRFRTLH
jgi:hypothetical protein